jgi:hypothetical protein
VAGGLTPTRSQHPITESVHGRPRCDGKCHPRSLSQVCRPTGADPAACWSVVTPPSSTVLDDLELHGPHDFRHTYATWLEGAGIPSRVIDEVMGHGGRRDGMGRGSAVGRRYRWTTPEMAARVVAAIEARLDVVLAVATRVSSDGDKPETASDG